FDDVDVHADGIAGAELRKVGLKRLVVDNVEVMHGVSSIPVRARRSQSMFRAAELPKISGFSPMRFPLRQDLRTVSASDQRVLVCHIESSGHNNILVILLTHKE